MRLPGANFPKPPNGGPTQISDRPQIDVDRRIRVWRAEPSLSDLHGAAGHRTKDNRFPSLQP